MSYKATLEANGTQYFSKGDSIVEAIGAFPLEFLALKTKSKLTVSAGKKSTTRDFTLGRGRLFLKNRINRILLAKQLQETLK